MDGIDLIDCCVLLQARIDHEANSFLVLILALVLLIFLQVLTRDKFNNIQRASIICGIIAIGLEIRASEFFLFNSVLGIDPWYHEWVSNFIVSSGNIPNGMAYSALPIFHIETAVGSELLNLSYKDSSFLTIVLLQGNSLFNCSLLHWKKAL